MVTSVALTEWQLGNFFRPTRVFSYYIEYTDWFVYWYFMSSIHFTYISILLYIYFDYLTLFSISRYSNLENLIFCFVYLTGYFILTLFTSFLRLGASLHCYRILLVRSVVNIFDLIVIIGYCYLVNPLDRILQNHRVYYLFDYLILRFLWCIYLFWGYQMLCMLLAIPKGICEFKLCFLTGCLVSFSNRTLSKFR